MKREDYLDRMIQGEIVWLSRPPFRGAHADTKPKWHILDDYYNGQYHAACGYKWLVELDDARLKITTPKVSDRCVRCTVT